MYSEKVMDHFNHPRNVGEMENPSGVGTVGNAKCGDIMRMYLDIDDNGIIQEAKFKTFGCGAAVATSSMATELVKGKTIQEALEVTNKAVMEALDGLPPVKVHCSLLAEEAIHAALWDYAEKNGIKIEGLERPVNDISEKEEEEELQLHVGQEEADPVTDARAVPIYATSSYVFHNSQHAADRFGLKDAGNIYGRLTNPTEDVFEKRIAALEGGVAALAVASGAAAITYTIENLAHAGDHIVAANNIYGGSYNLLEHTLPDYGITTTFVDPLDVSNFEKVIQDNTKALYIETFGNPNSDVSDIEAIAKIAHAHKIPLVVDNTFATPYLLRPIEYGADIVVHSATKFIGGHGTAIGGVIVDSGKFDWEASGKFPAITEPNPSYHGISFSQAAGPAAFVTRIRAILLRDTGATISPFHAFMFLQGLETLSLRVERHVENALKVVEYLNNHPQVEKVHHPSVTEDKKQQELYKKYFPNGGGSIFTFEIKGDEQKAKDFIDNLEIFSLLANVADVKSLVIHPASTTHAQLNEAELAEQGIYPNTIRLSIGTENIRDIIEDLDEAFKAVK
jgi:O-acetylhomoserine (thiol)-lyase